MNVMMMRWMIFLQHFVCVWFSFFGCLIYVEYCCFLISQFPSFSFFSLLFWKSGEEGRGGNHGAQSKEVFSRNSLDISKLG